MAAGIIIHEGSDGLLGYYCSTAIFYFVDQCVALAFTLKIAASYGGPTKKRCIREVEDVMEPISIIDIGVVRSGSPTGLPPLVT
jgi:hypothetical protein